VEVYRSSLPLVSQELFHPFNHFRWLGNNSLGQHLQLFPANEFQFPPIFFCFFKKPQSFKCLAVGFTENLDSFEPNLPASKITLAKLLVAAGVFSFSISSKIVGTLGNFGSR
jgi:hypothetical protein